MFVIHTETLYYNCSLKHEIAFSNSSDFSFTFCYPINITILTLKFTATFMQYETQLTFQNLFFFRLVAFLIKIMKTHLLDKMFQSSYDMHNIFNIMSRFYIMRILLSQNELLLLSLLLLLIIKIHSTVTKEKLCPLHPQFFLLETHFYYLLSVS